MNEIEEVQLEWKYTPEKYFEEPICFKDEGFKLSISDGIALARIDPYFYSKNKGIKEQLTNLIENRLHARQIMFHEKFTLSKASRSDLRKDGAKNVFVELDSLVMSSSIGSVDIIVQDKEGNIVSNTKQDRMDKQNWFADTIDKYRSIDPTLDQMLRSYHQSVHDPADELVHLYEIRDALSSRFGNTDKALKNLRITKKEWDIIGDLANAQPFEEGRHRGKSAGLLRPAGDHELNIARECARNLVEKYLKFLESSGVA